MFWVAERGTSAFTTLSAYSLRNNFEDEQGEQPNKDPFRDSLEERR